MLCRYTKLTPLEHILRRPDTYIGSVEKQTQSMWVLDAESKVIVNKVVTVVPGMCKIFDEVVVNAADHKQRFPEMDRLEVTINTDENFIRVLNSGPGIPIEVKSTISTYLYIYISTCLN
jgi:DNA topoisomerase-2